MLILSFGDSVSQYLDPGSGGLPIMFHAGKSNREMSVIPLECPRKEVADNWWNESSNGRLVLQQHAIKDRNTGHHLAEWSDKIELDTAGTSRSIQCGQYIMNANIESLAGAFYRSNLITLAPRYIVKNMLHIEVDILSLSGSLHEVMQKVRHLRHGLTKYYEKMNLRVGPNESTIISNFIDVSFVKGIDKSRWGAFCVNSPKRGDGLQNKWHLIPMDTNGSTYFGEHDGCFDTMCGVLEAKVHVSDGTRIVSITHASVPPFRIENRSNDHTLQFVQNDDDAIVFELPPMHSCGYTWDCPHGKLSLRAVVVPKRGRSTNLFDEYAKDKSEVSAADSRTLDATYEERDVEGSEDSDTDVDTTNKSSLRSNKSIVSACSSRGSKISMSQISLDRKGLFSSKSRSYKLSTVGCKKDLPCPVQGKTTSTLKTHLRISAGTKILSFNDSSWLINQVEMGLLRKGGDFKSALVEMNMDGLSFYLMDDYPREVIGVAVRDVQIYKPQGSIQANARVQHFQVDAMLPNARYPIIVQPKAVGVDRQGHMIENNTYDNHPEIVNESDCFWVKHNEGEPVFEVALSYVPQSNMSCKLDLSLFFLFAVIAKLTSVALTGLPNVDCFICPMKLQLDVDYILRVFSMIVDSISKYSTTTPTATTTRANDTLKYITYGQSHSRLTYIEKLHIAPVWFEIEINIKPDIEIGFSESEAVGEAALTLNSIARSSNSAAVSGILAWVINVGANFAHVSPTFRYETISYSDRYCDILELLRDIAMSYIMQSIKQSYKVVFSMHLLGDPSLLVHQWRTGVSDLVFRTRTCMSCQSLFVY